MAEVHMEHCVQIHKTRINPIYVLYCSLTTAGQEQEDVGSVELQQARPLAGPAQPNKP